MEKMLADLRAAGWRVGAHNDFTLNGAHMAFWLLTHPARGLYVEAKGADDMAALKDCAAQIAVAMA